MTDTKEYVQKPVTEIVIGDLIRVDLESYPYLFNHITAEFDYIEVLGVTDVNEDSISLIYKSIGPRCYPKTTRLFVREPLVTAKKNLRGQTRVNFKDRDDHMCSLEESSMVNDTCVWLGLDDADPVVPARQAHRHGIFTNANAGWVKFPIPADVLLHTRMHLTREQVRDLLPYLIRFAETGELVSSETIEET